MSLRLHLHSLLACFYDWFCCGSVLLSSVLLDGCPGRDAILRLESTPTSNAVGSETSLTYFFFSLFRFHRKLCFLKKLDNRSVLDQHILSSIVTHTNNIPSRGFPLLLSAYTQRWLESRGGQMQPCTSPGPSPRLGTWHLHKWEVHWTSETRPGSPRRESQLLSFSKKKNSKLIWCVWKGWMSSSHIFSISFCGINRFMFK